MSGPGPRPLCDQQLPLDRYPPRPPLRCDLPAGHHSEEHYDRATRTVWLTPGTQPRHRPPPPDPGDPHARR